MFPSPAQSRRRAWGNLLFPLHNPGFGATVATITFLSAWLLIGIARAIKPNFIAVLANLDFGDALEELAVNIFFASPWPLLAALGVFAGLSGFAAAGGWKRYAVGGAHALLNLALFLAAVVAGLQGLAAAGDDGLPCLVALTAAMAVYGFFVPPFIMGVYLIVSLLVFHRHRTEAFSSMRIADFKGFLRLHIDRSGTLRIYPVAIEKTPAQDDGPLEPKLLEPAIVIPN